jgi:hypothetical protein
MKSAWNKGNSNEYGFSFKASSPRGRTTLHGCPRLPNQVFSGAISRKIATRIAAHERAGADRPL